MSRSRTVDRCCCDACDREIRPGDRVYYRGRLVFCCHEEAEDFDARTYARQERDERLDRLRALRWARRNNLLRAG